MKYYYFKLIPPRATFPGDITPAGAQLMQEHSAYWKEYMNQGRHAKSFALCIVLLTASSAVQSRPQLRVPQPSPIAAVSANQQPTLTKVDKQHILHDNFTVINKVATIPKPVLDQLLGKNGVDAMADPGQPFQETDVVIGKPLPFRRLIFAARSANYCLVYFEHGGIAYGTEVSLYHLADAKVVLAWNANMREYGPSKTLPSLQSKISKGYYF